MQRFVLVAGGIHITPEGLPCRGMDHNAAREAAIDEIAATCQAVAAGTMRVGAVLLALICRLHAGALDACCPLSASWRLRLVSWPTLPLSLLASAGSGGITWTAVDASVYFKDVGR